MVDVDNFIKRIILKVVRPDTEFPADVSDVELTSQEQSFYDEVVSPSLKRLIYGEIIRPITREDI